MCVCNPLAHYGIVYNMHIVGMSHKSSLKVFRNCIYMNTGNNH